MRGFVDRLRPGARPPAGGRAPGSERKLAQTAADGPLQGVIPVDRPLFVVGRSGAGKTRLIRRLITENHFGKGAAIHVVSREFGACEYADLEDRLVSCLPGWDGFHDTVQAVHAAAEAREGQERGFRRRVLIVDCEGDARRYFRRGVLNEHTAPRLARLLRRGPALGTVVVFTSQVLLGGESPLPETGVFTAVMVDYPRSDIIAQVGGARYSHRL